MNKIRKLSSEVVSKIAAGEVVERPTNVVKELIENALDANSSKIEIIIENGGLQSITVKDNGIGIPPDDLNVAFELHTTSKLDNGDPSVVSTLGFRGEALSSIAAVSIVECQSKTNETSQGSKIVIEGGNVKSKNPSNCPKGTKISVRGLFFNTPARRKFLKSASTERKRIVDLVTTYSLMYPEVHFRLDEKSNSREIRTRVESPPRKSLLAVIYDVLGPETAEKLIPASTTLEGWEISGFISTPDLNRGDRSQQYLSVNGRPVSHPKLQSTIEVAYTSYMMRNSHPIFVLQFSGPIDAVDFNVHPQKSEVRFKTGEKLFEELPNFILECLKQQKIFPEIHDKSIQKIPKSKLFNEERLSNEDNILDRKSISTSSRQTMLSEFGLADQSTLPKKSDFNVHAHIMNKFGVVTSGDELWLVDVHAADERIKFELYSHGKERKPSSQQFLQPVSIHLIEAEKNYLLDNSDELENFGIKISNGGENILLLHSIPVYFDQDITEESISKMVKDILKFLTEGENKTPIQSPFNLIEYAIASRLACHGSVRSGYKVSPEKIHKIISELLKCEYPWTCAHGRPTILRIPKTRLEYWFKR